jgi:hexosaminidase
MHKTILQLAFIFAIISLFAFSSLKAQSVDYQVVPMPNEILLQGSIPFIIDNRTVIVYPAGNEQMKRNAEFLSQYIFQNTDFNLKLSTKAKKSKQIVLKTGLISDNAEAYSVVIDRKLITITGASESAVFYGIQTLRKSIPIAKKLKVDMPSILKVDMPAVIINDEPRFAYRGMMLDVARHYCSVDSIKRYIDILALHNINTFHWHLTEDQGWRIEIKKYPGLTEIGSIRKETVIGKNTGKYDGKPHGGFYTQEEARDIVAYAAERYINVIPEVDMPGHMMGALAAYPELGCTGGPYEVWRQWGVSKEVLCVGNDKTLEFIKDVLTEIMDIFPSKYIHVGGDECPKTNWKTCPKCQARIEELGLEADDHHTAEERLQSYFIGYAESIINQKGRRMIGWDEILEGGLAPNATVMSWRGVKGGMEAARLGHDVVMTPNTHFYFDYYQTKDVKNVPLAIGGFLPLEKVYSFEPRPSTLTEEQKKHIVGVQANLWTEYVPNFRHAEYMLMPRIAALCETQWMQPERKNYELFLMRMGSMLEIYKFNNYNYAKHEFEK